MMVYIYLGMQLLGKYVFRYIFETIKRQIKQQLYLSNGNLLAFQFNIVFQSKLVKCRSQSLTVATPDKETTSNIINIWNTVPI